MPRDADFWRKVISETQQAKSKDRRRRAAAVKSAGDASAARAKDSALATLHMSASATVRAAGLLVNKQADRFERNLTQRLQNVKGIDLDGDGQIDDDELDYAKEMEARLIRSRAFVDQVIHYGIPWKWFGGGLESLSAEDRLGAIFRNPHFDVNLDKLTTKMRNYLLTRSPSVGACLSPRPESIPSSADRRKAHENAMWNAPEQAMHDRIRAAASDPLTTQPDSYRKYLTEVNPITGKFIWE
jgi:hypothetical protein